eukprot:792003-Prymnesium_polylepis.1
MVSVEEGDQPAGAELMVAVEPRWPTLEPLELRAAKKRDAKSYLRQAAWPVKYVLVVALFLTIIVFMLAVSIAQGLGMLAMSLTMPAFMRLVYPSRIGQVHSAFLGWYRR